MDHPYVCWSWWKGWARIWESSDHQRRWFLPWGRRLQSPRTPPRCKTAHTCARADVCIFDQTRRSWLFLEFLTTLLLTDTFVHLLLHFLHRTHLPNTIAHKNIKVLGKWSTLVHVLNRFNIYIFNFKNIIVPKCPILIKKQMLTIVVLLHYVFFP